ncbi:MAG: Bax inhibitor-1 family protein [Candidatus Peribacteraceae bacterium]|nr:Bax inhibitor-1 family protein [Candidatus Peribacteraceae bacterium]
MSTFSRPHSSAIILDNSTLSRVYFLFALALGLTFSGIYAGMTFALPIITSGWMFGLLMIELLLIVTSRAWMNISPLNYILFALFPLFSGLTITPFLLSVTEAYVNGASILLNAAISTALMSTAAGIFAYTTNWNLGMFSRFLFFSLVGLVAFSLIQLFVPFLRTGITEVFASGFGIVVFSLYTAYDIQRIQTMATRGASPFMLALSLYLDIFNLFLYIARFMLAISGNRR